MSGRSVAEQAVGREPLSRERVLAAAVTLADEAGIEALSMRRLGQALGVQAMSLYHHVPNREAILDGIVDIVLGEVEIPGETAPWKPSIRRIAISTHEALVRHPWAASQMLSSSGIVPGRVRYMDAMLAALRRGGFSARLIDLAYHALDSHVLGFTLWQVQMDLDPDTLPDLAGRFLAALPAGAYPDLVEHVQQHLRHAEPEGEGSFAFGLDLILDGLEGLQGPAGGSRVSDR